MSTEDSSISSVKPMKRREKGQLHQDESRNLILSQEDQDRMLLEILKNLAENLMEMITKIDSTREQLENAIIREPQKNTFLKEQLKRIESTNAELGSKVKSLCMKFDDTRKKILSPPVKK